MIHIAYPERRPAIKTQNEKELVWCVARKKWVVLTPEEWVRQNFILFLTEVLQYPLSLMAVEKKVVIGELHKRFDIVVYREKEPWMLIECKEMNVPIHEKILPQILSYNVSLQAAYFIVTNGSYCLGFECTNQKFQVIETLPAYAG